MRLEEFSDTDRGIARALKAKGYKLLGSGVDQTAFVEPGTGYILKVFGTQCTKRGQIPSLSRDQKMFKLWANFCAKNQNNPFLPRIHGYDTFVWDTEDNRGVRKPCLYLQIRTEPLKHVPGSYAHWLSELSEAAEYGTPWKEIYEDLEFANFRTFRELTNTPEKMARMAHFYKTMQSLSKLGNAKGFSWDLHSHNIMMRSDGTLVINDPWVL